MKQFNIFAYSEDNKELKRNFLIESVDEQIARALFIIDKPGWEIELTRPARCFSSSSDHKGVLSVWLGRNDKTAVLCQHHGENPPQH